MNVIYMFYWMVIHMDVDATHFTTIQETIALRKSEKSSSGQLLANCSAN